MADPTVLEGILAQFVADMKTIAAPLHSQTVGRNVIDEWLNEGTYAGPWPAIYFYAANEQKFLVGARGDDAFGADPPVGIQGVLCSLNVIFLAKCTGNADRAQIGRAFWADVEGKLVPATGDRMIAGSVVRVEPQEIEYYVQAAYEHTAGGHAVLGLYYEHALGNPRQAVGG